MNVDKVESGAEFPNARAHDCSNASGTPCGDLMDRVNELVRERDAAARDGEKWRKERDEARALLKEAREYVACFVGADADEAMTCPKVDIPKDGYPRQYAVNAAPETIGRIDAELKPTRKEGQSS